ncbi:MAG: hypothetical protein A3F11_10440 [Gammaproteobacteria bacterium RIFCSPHIGHO2_12_FULL_37_14]|nr:MAG: hypothetical protein A3F11_10440 [Gammaproteobacteria bacterium RIFCSPHIGHO2_12_FULL_37_14]
MKIFGYLLIVAGCCQCCFAANDGTSIQPPPATVMYLEATSNSPVVQNEKYTDLPVCPSSITNCPDVNGNGGSSTLLADCPDYCRRTRTPPISHVPGTDVPQTITDAICPSSYKMVGVYDMAPEVVNKDLPEFAPKTQAELLYLRQRGVPCYGGPEKSDKISTDVLIMMAEYQDVENVYLVTNLLPNSCECFKFNALASKSTWESCSCTESGASVIDYKIYYKILMCNPPLGQYVAENFAPISIVCARIKTTWKSLQ